MNDVFIRVSQCIYCEETGSNESFRPVHAGEIPGFKDLNGGGESREECNEYWTPRTSILDDHPCLFPRLEGDGSEEPKGHEEG